MAMKVVVLGANGFIGKALRERLRAEEIEHEAVFTSATAGDTNLADFRYAPPELANADVVYLCAGRTGGVGRMASDPSSFLYPNVRIQMNMLQICALSAVKRLVILQSTTGYPDSGKPMREDDYLTGEPHPAYFSPGHAGRFIQRVATLFPELEVVFFRPSNVYGPSNNFDPKTSHVIEATVRKVGEHQDPFVIWGTGEETRDAVYIDDLARAMVHGLDCEPGAYNVGTGEEMSVNQIVDTLLVEENYGPTIQYDAGKPTAIPARRVDCSKLRALGWAPEVSMKEGLIRTLNWFKANR